MACIDERCQNPCRVANPCTGSQQCLVTDTLPTRTVACVCPQGFVSGSNGECKQGKETSYGIIFNWHLINKKSFLAKQPGFHYITVIHLQLKYEPSVMTIQTVESLKSVIKETAWMLVVKRDVEITQNASIQFMMPDVSAFQASLEIPSASASHVSIFSFQI